MGEVGVVHGEAPDRASTLISYAVPAFAYLRLTTDTTVKAVIFEDVAALIGLVLAAAGVGLRQLTGQSAWDGLASMAVGVLLVVAAASLARTNLSLLIGQAARPQLQAALRGDLESLPGVVSVPVFAAVVIGPGDLLIAAKVHFAAAYSAADIERAADEAERRLRARFPGVRYVFLDPTPSASDLPSAE